MAIFGTILSALNIASSLKGNNRRNTINAAVTNARNNNFSSIAAKASEGILQFPVIISDSISYEAAVMTAKALERSYAAFLLTIFSMNSVTNDLSNDGTITNYLRSLHDNSLNATMDSDDAGDDVSGNQIIDAFRQATRESTTLTGEVKDPENDNIVFTWEAFVPKTPIMGSLLKKELTYYLEGFCLDKLNDKFQPVKLENAGYAVPMFEARGKNSMKFNELEKENEKLKDQNKDLKNQLHQTRMKFEVKNQKDVNLLPGDVRKANELQPTLIKVNIKRSVRDTNTLTEYNFIIGVKATLHLAPSTEFVNNLVSACEYKGALFRFVKWSSGEISFLKDFVLRLDEFSKDIKSNTTAKTHWWDALKRRARDAKISKISANRLLPNATFVFTTNEVDYIKANFGYDLLNMTIAQRLMKEYFLLGYVVLDPANEIAHILYDGQKNFQVMTFKNMEREGANVERQFKDILRATKKM